MRIKKQKKAFTIAELLIALAISAMLLAAVAVAFNASAKNYKVNEEIFQTMNSARQAMLRMTAQLRTADCNSVSISTTSTECTLTTTGGSITYRYNDAEKKLYLVTSDNDYVLCDNVTTMRFTRMPTDTGLPVKSVQISITVGIDNVQQTVSSAAVIRKNLN